MKFYKQIFPETLQQENLIIYYDGVFDNEALSKLREGLREVFNEDNKTFAKIFAIIVELCQNISRYSCDQNFFGYKQLSNSGNGIIAVLKSGNQYKIATQNIVKEADKNEIKERCDLINESPYDDLRNLKKKFRIENENSSTGNIGLVQIAIKSHGKLEYEFYEISKGYLLFNLIIKTNF